MWSLSCLCRFLATTKILSARSREHSYSIKIMYVGSVPNKFLLWFHSAPSISITWMEHGTHFKEDLWLKGSWTSTEFPPNLLILANNENECIVSTPGSRTSKYLIKGFQNGLACGSFIHILTPCSLGRWSNNCRRVLLMEKKCTSFNRVSYGFNLFNGFHPYPYNSFFLRRTKTMSPER